MQFRNGAAVGTNFDAHRMLRLNEMPKVEVEIIASGAPLGGVGEIGVPPIAPAIANAYFNATGKRMRSLPLFPQV
jgi:isoquinoline 1-oxidoreductase beta subunit